MFFRSVVVCWFATPWTPPLWQRGFILVNCSCIATLFDFGEKRCRKNLPLCDSGNPIDREFSQSEWDSLIQRFPAGTHVDGVVAATPVYGVWVTLDDLPDVPALLEIIHFAVIESDSTHRIEHPRDYPPAGTRISARILAWCQTPKDVRLTQLSHLEWVHNRSESDAES